VAAADCVAGLSNRCGEPPERARSSACAACDRLLRKEGARPLDSSDDKTRYVPDGIAAEWTDRMAQEAMQLLKQAFDPANMEDGRVWTHVSVALRQGERQFRARLLEAYGGRCAVTGNRVVEVLEAAHIVPYLGAQTNHISNGLLLRADIHSLYDQGLLAIDSSSLTILVAPSIRSTVYGKFAGQPLRLPADHANHPNKQAIDLHRASAGL